MAISQYFWLMASVAVLGVAAAIWVRKRMKLKRARAWPVEVGRVDSTVVRLEQRGTQQSIYVAAVMYSYTAQGMACSGSLRRQFLLKGSADKWVARYPAGLPVNVRYNPDRAQESVLFDDEQAGAGAA